MAIHMTVLALDEDEKTTLREVYDTKRFTALMKPVGDNLRSGLSELKRLATPETIEKDAAQRGRDLAVSLLEELSTVPDSEAKTVQVEALKNVKDIFKDILEMDNAHN